MVLDNVIASIIRRAFGLEMNRKKYIQVPNTRPDQGDSLLLAPWRLVATSGKHVRVSAPLACGSGPGIDEPGERSPLPGEGSRGRQESAGELSREPSDEDDVASSPWPLLGPLELLELSLPAVLSDSPDRPDALVWLAPSGSPALADRG